MDQVSVHNPRVDQVYSKGVAHHENWYHKYVIHIKSALKVSDIRFNLSLTCNETPFPFIKEWHFSYWQ